VQTELEWVRKIRTGDGEAYEQLFRSYCQPLIHFARRYVRDTSIAEGLVQKIFSPSGRTGHSWIQPET